MLVCRRPEDQISINKQNQGIAKKCANQHTVPFMVEKCGFRRPDSSSGRWEDQSKTTNDQENDQHFDRCCCERLASAKNMKHDETS